MATTTSTPAPGWLGRIGGSLFQRRAVIPAAAPAVQDRAASEQRSPTLAILAGALRTPHGASAEELGAALAANKVDADLDRELIDDDGFPVMSARCDLAAHEMAREEVASWLAANATPQPHFGDEQWRALLLGTAVLRELAERAATVLAPDEGAAPMLQLAPLLPQDWPAEQRQAAAGWFGQVLVQSGWPAVHATVAEAVTPAALIARLAHEAQTAKAPVATIVLACASCIGQETVERWSSNGTLLTAAHPGGRIPGEGAAALLLAPPSDNAGLAHISLETAPCDRASGSGKRLSPQVLNTLAERLLQGAAIAAGDIAMIVADTGPDTRHVLELMEFGGASAPHLDNASDIVRIGPACGACDPVPFVAALALAAHATLAHDAPLLCVSNDTPDMRALALVRPGPSLENKA